MDLKIEMSGGNVNTVVALGATAMISLLAATTGGADVSLTSSNVGSLAALASVAAAIAAVVAMLKHHRTSNSLDDAVELPRLPLLRPFHPSATTGAKFMPPPVSSIGTRNAVQRLGRPLAWSNPPLSSRPQIRSVRNGRWTKAPSAIVTAATSAVEPAVTSANSAAKPREDIRNVAIIAHVDHGKTTLVDAMLRHAASKGASIKMDDDKDARVMDSNDQERERGITILAKNVAVEHKGVKVNLVDTPGHADFGGEVERIMNMVDGVLLVVDSVEGPKPQTRFVLKKALERGHKVLLVVNKIDRPNRRPEYVVDTTFDLMADLGGNDEQLDFDVIYTSAINMISGEDPEDLKDGMEDLFDKVLDLPAPCVASEDPCQLLIANIDYDSFIGKLGVGRVQSGKVRKGQQVVYGKPGEVPRKAKLTNVFKFDNLGRTEVEEADAGEIVVIAGAEAIGIGDTIMDPESPSPLPPIDVEEPTVRMTFGVNKSPFAGKEGKLLTSRLIRERLEKELDRNVALKVDFEGDGTTDTFEVSGRGQLHLTVLIETMRREGFELMVGPPQVITKEENGIKMEPYETVEARAPDEFMGSVIDLLNKRKGQMLDMGAPDNEGFVEVKYSVPTRGMVGIRSQLLTATRGTVVLDSTFEKFGEWAGELDADKQGSLLAFEDGVTTAFAMANAQERGNLFIEPREDVYRDMIVGIHQRPGDLHVNVCKTKQLTNMRSAGADSAIKLTPPMELTLESAVEYISGEDEVLEITPTGLRMSKVPGWEKRQKKVKNAKK